MNITLSKDAQENYQLNIGVIIARNINNGETNEAISQLLKNQEDRLKSAFNKDSILDHPHIADTSKFAKSLFLDLIEKSFQDKNSSNLNKTPNRSSMELLCNFIALKYLLPVIPVNLDSLGENISGLSYNNSGNNLVLASQNNLGQDNLGQNNSDNYKLILNLSTGEFNNLNNFKVTKDSKNILITILSSENIDLLVLKSAVNELDSLIEQYLGGTASSYILDKDTQEITATQDKQKNKNQKINQKGQDSEQNLNFDIDVYSFNNILSQGSYEHKIRLEKVEKLKALGINPWPPVKKPNALNSQVIEAFNAGNTEKILSVSGRIMSIRHHGKAAFANIQDESGQLQLYIKKDIAGENLFNLFKDFIDIGDIVWCSGHVFKTKMGEITLEVSDLELQSKCLFPLPEKFHGLTDREIKYRQRYLDLIVNSDARERFTKRSLLISTMRKYLNNLGYLEVETPMLHPIAGGAAARPFITHHNALNADFYLRIAPELYLKRLIIGGLEKVYEINRNFRNEGVSTRHNPEFTMIEFYTAYQDYNYAMALVEDLFKTLACALGENSAFKFGEIDLDFGKPFEKISMRDSVIKYGNIKEEDLSEGKIDKTLESHKIKLEPGKTAAGYKLLALFEALVEHKLIQPTFITGFPVEISPLAKRDPNNKNLASRFELFIAGMEISNGFNELNDPFDQADRFREQLINKETGDLEAHDYDADYIRAMEYALPPTVGVGIGIDRLTMLLTNTPTIREVILFPTLRKK